MDVDVIIRGERLTVLQREHGRGHKQMWQQRAGNTKQNWTDIYFIFFSFHPCSCCIFVYISSSPVTSAGWQMILLWRPSHKLSIYTSFVISLVLSSVLRRWSHWGFMSTCVNIVCKYYKCYNSTYLQGLMTYYELNWVDVGRERMKFGR